MNISNYILSKLTQEQGLNNIELENNIEINNLIELMANELKSSFIVGDGPDWETKLYVRGEHPLLPEDLTKMAKELLAKNPHIDNMMVARFMGSSDAKGLHFNIDRTVENNGKVDFNLIISELDYITTNLLGADKKMQHKIQNKLLNPYLKYLKKHSDELDMNNNSKDGIKISEELVNKFKNIIKKDIPEGMDVRKSL